MTHIQQRYDLAVNWLGQNPILMEGEVGWESDTRKSKIGDGVSRWMALPYTNFIPTKADIGLDQVNNTADLDKPISTATQNALNSLNASDVAMSTRVGNVETRVTTAETNITNNSTAITNARAKRWAPGTAYSVGAVVGHNGSVWRCTAATTAGQAPSLFTSKWERVMGVNPDMIPLGDPYFNGDNLDNWSLFWKTGTVNSASLTTTASALDTGRQSLVLDMAAAATQRVYANDEMIVQGGETVRMQVRAKLLFAVSGTVTVTGDLAQSDVGVPEPFGTGMVSTSAFEGAQTIDTTWRTFTFTFLAKNGKPRGKAAPIFTMPAGAGGQIAVAWIKQKKIGDSGVLEGVTHVVGATGEPAFQNSWVNESTAAAPAQFTRDGRRVQLEGVVSHAAVTNSVIFTLPVGYRPAVIKRFVVYSGSGGNGFAVVVVNTDGTVYLAAVGTNGATTFVALDQVSFLTPA